MKSKYVTKYMTMLNHAAQMAVILSGVALAFCLPAHALAKGTPMLVTVSESASPGAPHTAWWPNHFERAQPWNRLFAQRGLTPIDPTQNAPRLSPTVYGQAPLSDANARTMASLFGARAMLNGSIAWTCTTQAQETACQAHTDLRLFDDTGRMPQTEYRRTLQAIAQTQDDAQNQIRARITLDLSIPASAMTRAQEARAIPRLTDNPVIVLDAIPDADTLVAIRKRLKRIPAIDDISEAWVSQGTLALELNPGKPLENPATFQNIMQAFLSDTQDDFVVRELAHSDAGAIVEIVQF